MIEASVPSAPDLRSRAIGLLMQAASLADMRPDEAERVVDAMHPVHLLPDTLLFEEGDADDNDYLALVLDGQVRVATGAGEVAEEVVISILGPGHLIGEMGVVDGGPRSASCITITEVKLGVLSSDALQRLLAEHPTTAARLLMGVARGLALRVRESNRRLRTLSQVTRALQDELDAVHVVNRKLLEDKG